MSDRGCRQIVVTGSVFEAGEGAGSESLPAFSPYGVSKALTASIVEYYAGVVGSHLGKFVIPNPFGPFEEPRFTAYLAKKWQGGKVAGVNTPDYVRDNIHVDLLALAYSQFVETLPVGAGLSKMHPSGYVESQGQFAQRFANNMRERTGLECGLDFAVQTEFLEPRIRINSDPAVAMISSWSESNAWDQLAAYYSSETSFNG